MLYEIEFEYNTECFDELLVVAELILYPPVPGADSDWDAQGGYDIFSFSVFDAFTNERVYNYPDEEVLAAVDKYVRDLTVFQIMQDNEYF